MLKLTSYVQSEFKVNKYFILVHRPGPSFALFNCESDFSEIDEACHFKGFFFCRGLDQEEDDQSKLQLTINWINKLLMN